MAKRAIKKNCKIARKISFIFWLRKILNAWKFQILTILNDFKILKWFHEYADPIKVEQKYQTLLMFHRNSCMYSRTQKSIKRYWCFIKLWCNFLQAETASFENVVLKISKKLKYLIRNLQLIVGLIKNKKSTEIFNIHRSLRNLFYSKPFKGKHTGLKQPRWYTPFSV